MEYPGYGYIKKPPTNPISTNQFPLLTINILTAGCPDFSQTLSGDVLAWQLHVENPSTESSRCGWDVSSQSCSKARRHGSEPRSYKTRDSLFQETSQDTPNRAVSTFPVIWGKAARSFPVSLWHSEMTKSRELQDKGWGHGYPAKPFFFFAGISNLPQIALLKMPSTCLLVSKSACDCQDFTSSIPVVPLDIRMQFPLPSQPDHRPPTSPFLERGNDVRFLGGEGRECWAKLISSSNLAPWVQRAWQGLFGTQGKLQDRSRKEFCAAHRGKTRPALGSSTRWERDLLLVFVIQAFSIFNPLMTNYF